MVLDPIPQSLPVHFFGSRPQPPTSPPDLVTWARLSPSFFLFLFLPVFARGTWVEDHLVTVAWDPKNLSPFGHFSWRPFSSWDPRNLWPFLVTLDPSNLCQWQSRSRAPCTYWVLLMTSSRRSQDQICSRAGKSWMNDAFELFLRILVCDFIKITSAEVMGCGAYSRIPKISNIWSIHSS